MYPTALVILFFVSVSSHPVRYRPNTGEVSGSSAMHCGSHAGAAEELVEQITIRYDTIR